MGAGSLAPVPVAPERVTRAFKDAAKHYREMIAKLPEKLVLLFLTLPAVGRVRRRASGRTASARDTTTRFGSYLSKSG